MVRAKLTPADRRSLTLRSLRGESPTELAREYGLHRSRVYAIVEEETRDSEDALAEAEAELAYRREVAGIVLGGGFEEAPFTEESG